MSPLVYLLVVHGGAPVCEAWTKDDDAQVLRHGERELPYDSCGQPQNWFTNEATCRSAIAHHERRGTDLSCASEEQVPPSIQIRLRRVIVDALAYGGVFWATSSKGESEVCVPVRFDARRAARTNDHVEGEMSYRVWDGEGHRGRETYDYEYRPSTGELTLLGPGFQYDDPDTYSGAYGCMDITFIEIRRESIIAGKELFLTPERCVRSIAEERARERWLPGYEPVADAPLVGGC